MTKAVKELLKAVNELSEEEQDELITALLTLHDPIKSEEELLTPELKAELDRRIAYLDAHPEDGVTPEEAIRQAKELNRKLAGK